LRKKERKTILFLLLPRGLIKKPRFLGYPNLLAAISGLPKFTALPLKSKKYCYKVVEQASRLFPSEQASRLLQTHSRDTCYKARTGTSPVSSQQKGIKEW
ncbi:MAG: hypothetical protein SXA11_10325, partial [Cyanobacteriota bacterium]|nr:hypothetical protein [Cyanobacteriota bacterium]